MGEKGEWPADEPDDSTVRADDDSAQLPVFTGGRRTTGEDEGAKPAGPGSTRWTREEVERLAEVVERNRTGGGGQVDWSVVLRSFPHRTRVACCSALRRRNSSGGMRERIVRRPFSRAEEAVLLEAVRKHGERKWAKVAEEVVQTTGIHRPEAVYYSHWSFVLCPKARSAPHWTSAMSKRLREVAAVHGKDPIFLAYKFFPSYTPSMLSRMLLRMGTPLEDLDPRRLRFLKKPR
ncbi:hypothetical protein LPJ61_002514 [Coemansia biformis]|uniref:Myb-like domain-containing protein n=1 Tax=Coemansia biformis TaxID=1286918 RepID=A0A9W8CWD5_9FUNG|nr:hypothetical protein LPJ61_002514 [Coemansia biformis]